MTPQNLIRSRIRSIPNFPKPGIIFRDVTTLWRDAEAFDACMGAFAERFADFRAPGLVVGIESRGFVFGSAYAARMGLGFVPVRKRGKLPAEVHSHEYELEYGTDCVEIHRDAVEPGQRVI